MLTPEGKAYIEAAIFILQHAYRENPIEEHELAEYLNEHAKDISEQGKKAITLNLIYESQNPKRLQESLIHEGWLKEKII